MTHTRSPSERRAMFANMGKDYHAMNKDISVRAANTLPDTPENRKEWEKDSRRIDIEGIDTPIKKRESINNKKDNNRLREEKAQETKEMEKMVERQTWFVDGNTYDVKDELKSRGMKWNPNEKYWGSEMKPDIEGLEGITLHKTAGYKTEYAIKKEHEHAEKYPLKDNEKLVYVLQTRKIYIDGFTGKERMVEIPTGVLTFEDMHKLRGAGFSTDNGKWANFQIDKHVSIPVNKDLWLKPQIIKTSKRGTERMKDIPQEF